MNVGQASQKAWKAYVIEGSICAEKIGRDVYKYANGKMSGRSLVKRSVSNVCEHGAAAVGADVLSRVGAAVGTMVFPVLGTVVGAVTGGILGGIAGSWLGKKVVSWFRKSN